jgi:hypothetical protein
MGMGTGSRDGGWEGFSSCRPRRGGRCRQYGLDVVQQAAGADAKTPRRQRLGAPGSARPARVEAARRPRCGCRPRLEADARARAGVASAMACSSTRAASGVALVGVLPVLVFRKSAPASSAIRSRGISAASAARRFRGSPSASALAGASHGGEQLCAAFGQVARQGSTTSTSCAPACDDGACRARRARCRCRRRESWPPPRHAMPAGSCARANAARRGHTHTAATAPCGP